MRAHASNAYPNAVWRATRRGAQSQDAADTAQWGTTYAMLMWLSILVLIPFDLSTVDSRATGAPAAAGSGSDGGERTLVRSIVRVCQAHLSDSGPTRNAAAVAIARLLTRPDMVTSHLDVFLGWANGARARAPTLVRTGGWLWVGMRVMGGCAVHVRLAPWPRADILCQVARGEIRNVFLTVGVFLALTEISKHGQRDSLRAALSRVFESVRDVATASVASKSSSQMRRMTAKLAQRIALTYLPPRVVSWRYQRGARGGCRNCVCVGGGGARRDVPVRAENARRD